jgi:hypothetical protein
MATPLQLAPVPASIDNPADWDPIMQLIARRTGLPPTITLDSVLGLVRGAVPLIFEAQSAGTANLLRGTFGDPVVAQCQLNIGCLLSGRPESAVAHLVGGRVADGRPILRVHVLVQGRGPDGEQTIDRQFWDLVLGAEVTVSQPDCPNCGAPVAQGELICDHCGADVRSTVEVPLVVSRLELY